MQKLEGKNNIRTLQESLLKHKCNTGNIIDFWKYTQ